MALACLLLPAMTRIQAEDAPAQPNAASSTSASSKANPAAKSDLIAAVNPTGSQPIKLESKSQAPVVKDALEERKQHIADESTALLQLAAGLQDEVDSTNKDVLSLAVVRQAAEIEKVAHNLKEEAKTKTK